MYLKTFAVVVLLGSSAILILSITEPLLAEPPPDSEQVRLLDAAPSIDRLSGESSLFSFGPFRTLSARSGNTKCSICERRFFADDEVTLTDCRHIFHRRCFEEWTSVEISCPTCQTSLV
jgi:hypothetical protein